MWKDRAVEIWGMNYPGFGGSTGPARLARIGPAAVAAFDALRREAADAPIVAYGRASAQRLRFTWLRLAPPKLPD